MCVRCQPAYLILVQFIDRTGGWSPELHDQLAAKAKPYGLRVQVFPDTHYQELLKGGSVIEHRAPGQSWWNRTPAPGSQGTLGGFLFSESQHEYYGITNAHVACYAGVVANEIVTDCDASPDCVGCADKKIFKSGNFFSSGGVVRAWHTTLANRPLDASELLWRDLDLALVRLSDSFVCRYGSAAVSIDGHVPVGEVDEAQPVSMPATCVCCLQFAHVSCIFVLACTHALVHSSSSTQ